MFCSQANLNVLYYTNYTSDLKNVEFPGLMVQAHNLTNTGRLRHAHCIFKVSLSSLMRHWKTKHDF